jgi:uroporphyrin-III C-methyltransferase/precorrin-2 dehydrogenase/sirohydrochlorin ferrochelatase/uroporphyrin-III C-methyltransferase
MSNQSTIGKVIITGAGPGDPDLITVKAVNHLQKADVVLTDRLVSDEILKLYVSSEAKVIYVGKQCRKGNSTPQEEINELIVEYAKQGKYVVRLKGGDVSIFSNVLDEYETLIANKIPYEVVPGITAASGAAAYAGIPLTARGHSTAVRILTYYKSDIVSDEYWKDLATTTDTLVFYMSAETLDKAVNKLIQFGIGKDKHIAVIEQATTPLQNVYASNVYDYFKKISGQNFVSPSLVIIGKVAALHEQFNWIANSDSKDYYFKPVTPLENKLTKPNQLKNVSRA